MAATAAVYLLAAVLVDPGLVRQSPAHVVEAGSGRPRYVASGLDAGPAGAPTSQGDFVTSAVVTPGTVIPGTTADIAVAVQSERSQTVSVDVEIYNRLGVRVFEAAFDQQSIGAGETRSFAAAWRVPATTPPGIYSIQVGVFSADWRVEYTWNEAAGLIAVAPPSPLPATPLPATPLPATGTASPLPATASPLPATASPLPATASPLPATASPLPATASPLPATPPPAAMAGLRVEGNQILTSSGRAVRLRGVNRSSAEYACVEGYGIFEGPVDAASVAAMQAWRINAVRLPLNQDCWLGINGVDPAYSGQRYQDEIAAYVSLLTRHDIAVVANLHFSAPGTERATGQQPMADRDHSPAFWRSVAERFKDNSAVLFEPYNEPYPEGGATSAAAWTCWRDGGACPGVPFAAAGMQELVDVIRATGAPNVIVLTGLNYGSQLDGWLQYRPVDPLNQLVAGWHSYGDGLDCQVQACWSTVLADVLTHAPILATEIGQFDCRHDYIDRVMAFLDARGQGYLAWAWGPYDCAQDPALITDWAGTPTQTFGQGYRDHLLRQPQ
jgi:hypothetical protein